MNGISFICWSRSQIAYNPSFPSSCCVKFHREVFSWQHCWVGVVVVLVLEHSLLDIRYSLVTFGSDRRILQIATNIILHTTFHTSRNKGSTTGKMDCETVNARSQRPTIRSTDKNVNEVNLDNNLHIATNLFSLRVLYSSNFPMSTKTQSYNQFGPAVGVKLSRNCKFSTTQLATTTDWIDDIMLAKHWCWLQRARRKFTP